MHSSPWPLMDLSGKIHTPTALQRAKELRCLLNTGAGWHPERGWTFWREKKNLLVLPGIEIRFIGLPLHSLVTVPTTHLWW